MGDPLNAKDAKKQIRHILKNGRVLYSRPHAIERLRERNLTMVDCENVLRGGSVSQPYKEGNNWRHKVSTNNMTVIVQLLPYDQFMVVTAWREGGKK